MREYLAGRMKVFILDSTDTPAVVDYLKRLIANDFREGKDADYLRETYHFFIPEGRFIFQLPIELTTRYKY